MEESPIETPPPPTEEPLAQVSPEAKEPSKEKEPSIPQPNPSPISQTSKPKDTPSIFNRKKGKEEVSEDSPSVIAKNSEEFTEEALQKTWALFSENKPDAGDTDRLILNKKVSKGEEHKVIIHLGSQLEVSFLEKFEVELVQFLRTELSNDHITIKREIAKEEESKKLYTSKDIFEEMMKQNPHLKDLKDRLGLDFDY
ncbi:MAG: hypothetical protein AAF391_01595 [Bacteroidota bacterium]